MSNTKHTPTPYRIGDAGMTVFGPPNDNPAPQVICELRRKSDGPFLIAACNAHAELVAALRGMLNNFGADDVETPFIVRARAALAKVQS
jgi:hypothetical protein